MSKVNVFFAEGFEEVEALTVVDMLRRAGIDTDMVSVTGNKNVTGSHGISIVTDKIFEEINDDADMLVLPGGMPGTINLKSHIGLCDMIKRFYGAKKFLAAICAAPTVFGGMDMLKDRRATCYPGMEDSLNCLEALEDAVVIDDYIITSRGLGTAIDFSLALIGLLKDDVTADNLASSIVYTVNK